MKILVFPKDEGNPYQSLLYSPMSARKTEISYLRSVSLEPAVNLLIRVVQLIWYRITGHTVFHLHWTYAFAFRIKVRQSNIFNVYAYWCYVLTLVSIKMLGYKLVWTAHNTLPHEPVFGGAWEVAARKWLVKLADLVIVHSESTIDELSTLGLHPRKYAVIPHGSYVGVYPNSISQTEARRILNITENTFVYLFLGQIRDYKGLDRLLEAYSNVRTNDTALVIAGVCRDPELRHLLNERNDNSILWHDGLVPDEELQNYFNAADVVVLPFKKITTSGSSLLALSFGRAVIVPVIGDLAKLPSSVSYTYNPAQIDGLEQSMLTAFSDKEEAQKRGSAALEYAKLLAWSHIAATTLQVFEKLLKK